MTQPFELTHDGGLPLDADNPLDVVDASIGSPGSPAPAGMALVGGTDGATARALRVGADGVLEAEAASLRRRFGGGKSAYAAVLTANHDIIPAFGKKIRLYWVAFIPNKGNASANLVTVGFVGAASSLYVGYAMAHWEFFEGDVNQPLRIGLSTGEPVAVTVHYEEV